MSAHSLTLLNLTLHRVKLQLASAQVSNQLWFLVCPLKLPKLGVPFRRTQFSFIGLNQFLTHKQIKFHFSLPDHILMFQTTKYFHLRKSIVTSNLYLICLSCLSVLLCLPTSGSSFTKKTKNHTKNIFLHIDSSVFSLLSHRKLPSLYRHSEC